MTMTKSKTNPNPNPRPTFETTERALALAALLRSASMVHQTAWAEPIALPDQEYLLAPVLQIEADSVAELLTKGPERQRLLRNAAEVLAGDSNTPQVLGYAMELVELARRLGNHPALVTKLSDLLQHTPEAKSDALANVYQQTISTLGRRIQVTGEPGHLQQGPVADRIRALLLAGIRFAWLWRQLGGRRWQLVWSRRKLIQTFSYLETAHD